MGFGAQQLLQQAVEAELGELLAGYAMKYAITISRNGILVKFRASIVITVNMTIAIIQLIACVAIQPQRTAGTHIPL